MLPDRKNVKISKPASTVNAASLSVLLSVNFSALIILNRQLSIGVMFVTKLIWLYEECSKSPYELWTITIWLSVCVRLWYQRLLMQKVCCEGLFLPLPPFFSSFLFVLWPCSCQPTPWNICNNIFTHTKQRACKIHESSWREKWVCM